MNKYGLTTAVFTVLLCSGPAVAQYSGIKVLELLDKEIVLADFDYCRPSPQTPGHPGPQFRPPKSEQWTEGDTTYVETAQTCWHPVGTCRMGNDPDAVVDEELRVHGLAGLRVADASVLPHLVSSNTNAPSILVGERCAELLLSARR